MGRWGTEFSLKSVSTSTYEKEKAPALDSDLVWCACTLVGARCFFLWMCGVRSRGRGSCVARYKIDRVDGCWMENVRGTAVDKSIGESRLDQQRG